MSRLLSALALVMIVGLAGCEALDKATGVDDPLVLSGEKQSVVEAVSDQVDDLMPFPFDLILAGLVGAGAKTYRDTRIAGRKAKADAEAAA